MLVMMMMMMMTTTMMIDRLVRVYHYCFVVFIYIDMIEYSNGQ